MINLNGYSKDLRLILFFLLSLLLSYNVPAPSQIYSSVPCNTPPVLSSSVITIFSVFRFSPFLLYLMVEQVPLLKYRTVLVGRRFPLQDAVFEEGLVTAEAHVRGGCNLK